MDNTIFNITDTYFKMLAHKGYFPYCKVYNILILKYIVDVISNPNLCIERKDLISLQDTVRSILDNLSLGNGNSLNDSFTMPCVGNDDSIIERLVSTINSIETDDTFSSLSSLHFE